MRRDTLAIFFTRAVMAALPLLGGCPTIFNCPPVPDAQVFIVDGGLDDGSYASCSAICASEAIHRGSVTCEQQTNSAGQPVVQCTSSEPRGCIGGRRPAGLVDCAEQGSGLGRHFAVMAHLEAASVPAFRRLRTELRAHGAPRRLADACRRAARDEIRHARSAARLARRFGATRPRVEVPRAAPRSLMALAVENAREGCVAESYAALLATFGAVTAVDAEVRAHLQAIAADETRHAELAWDIDAWLRTRLSKEERAELAAVRAEELARIAGELDAPVDGELARTAGLPPPAAARALHRAFAAEITRRA